MEWYNERISEGFNSILNIEQIQLLMFNIVRFFEFKYSNNLLIDLSNNSDLKQCKKL